MNKLIKISSFAGTFLISCGVLKLIVYYSAFNISIVDFLSFSEIITSFFDDINVLLIFIIVMLIITVTVLSVGKESHKVKVEDYMEMLLRAVYPIRYKYVTFFAVLILVLFFLIFLDISGYNYLIIYLISFSTLQLLSYLIMSKNENNDIEFSDFHLALTVMISVVVSVILLAQHDIQEVKKNSKEVILYYKTSTIKCGKKFHYTYLGKTDHYIYLKRNSSKSGIAIKTEIIDMIEFK